MLDRHILKQVVEKIGMQIRGDWLIFGGTVPYLLGNDTRPTVDIDLAPFEVSTSQDTLILMEIAQELKLPIETLNQAGSFFLSKIKDWQKKVILVKAGKQGRVFRPTLELYLELKCARMTESDLSDCLAYLDWCHKHNELVLGRELEKMLSRKRKDSKNTEVIKRLDLLWTEVKKYK